MATDKKTLELIVKLIRLTVENEITWEMSDDTDKITQGTRNIVPILYIASYKERKFGIYEIKVLETFFDIEYERYKNNWYERVVLALLDTQNTVLWETSEQHSSALRNLFEAVRAQASGINNFIDELLADDNNSNSSKKESIAA